MEIRPVDHIRQKFSESRVQLQALHNNGETVTVLLHPSNHAEIADLIPEDWIIATERVLDASAIGVEIAALHSTAPSIPPAACRRVAIAIAPILLALCLIGYHLPVQALKNAYSYEQAGQHRRC